jgi:hypothetical protein
MHVLWMYSCNIRSLASIVIDSILQKYTGGNVDYLESIAPEMMQPACTMLEWYYIEYRIDKSPKI